MDEQPSGLMRLAYERCFYTDIADMQTITRDPFLHVPEGKASGKDKKE